MYSVCLMVSKLFLSEYVEAGFSSDRKHEKFAVGAHVLVNTQNVVISRRCSVEDAYEMYQVLLCTCRAIVLLIKVFVLPRRRCRCRRGLLKVPNQSHACLAPVACFPTHCTTFCTGHMYGFPRIKPFPLLALFSHFLFVSAVVVAIFCANSSSLRVILMEISAIRKCKISEWQKCFKKTVAHTFSLILILYCTKII